MLTLNRPRQQARPSSTPQWRRLLNLGLFFLLCSSVVLSPPVLALLLLGPATKCTAAECEAAARGLPHEIISFKAANGARLAGIFFPGKANGKVVLIHHGQGVNISNPAVIDTANVMVHAGASALVYDYEGYGPNDGIGSLPAFARDAEAAYSYLVQVKRFNPSDIVHCGISLGTGAACHVASRQPCAGVMLISPYLSISKVACHILPFLSLYPHASFPQPDIGSEELASSHVPVFIMHGTADPIIPVAHADETYRHAQGQKTYFRIPNGGHMGGMSCGSDPATSGAVIVCKQFLDSLPSSTSPNHKNPPVQITNLLVESSR